MIPVFHIFVFFTCGSNKLFVSGVLYHSTSFCVVAVQLLSCIQLFVTPWTPALQASLSFPVFWSLLMSIVYGHIHKYMQLILEQHWFGLLGSTFMQISSSNDIVLPLIPIHGFMSVNQPTADKNFCVPLLESVNADRTCGCGGPTLGLECPGVLLYMGFLEAIHPRILLDYRQYIHVN